MRYLLHLGPICVAIASKPTVIGSTIAYAARMGAKMRAPMRKHRVSCQEAGLIRKPIACNASGWREARCAPGERQARRGEAKQKKERPFPASGPFRRFATLTRTSIL